MGYKTNPIQPIHEYCETESYREEYREQQRGNFEGLIERLKEEGVGCFWGKVELMVEVATKLVMTWKTEIERQGGVAEINPNEDMKTFSSSIISKTLLGKSHFEGAEIFLKFRDIQKTFAGQSWLKTIVGLSKFPSKNNRWKWRLEEELNLMILNIAKDHMADSSETDILHKIIEGARNDADAKAEEKFIMDNCKNVYFVGYKSTAVSAFWTLMLLALHPEWQACARAKVLQLLDKIIAVSLISICLAK
ncbi:cytochrome P450 714C2-like [Cornus florida]|uniref:cytochrome P450 714C2-like n=1 Tax=Cornus florida TaxID=4283 RepID=UPI00289D77E6|nr:cytochrome P450 714C2-like [Cornus florida]